MLVVIITRAFVVIYVLWGVLCYVFFKGNTKVQQTVALH